MNEATVSSRMPESTKRQAQQILEKNGTNTSKVINALFERIVEEGGISFLMPKTEDKQELQAQNLKRAIEFIDSIPIKRTSKFDNMTHSEIKMQRLKDRGLL